MALIDSVRREITVLADGLAAHVAQPPGTRGKPNCEANEAAPDRIQLDWAARDLTFLGHLGGRNRDGAADR
jgi:hypothetical protein